MLPASQRESPKDVTPTCVPSVVSKGPPESPEHTLSRLDPESTHKTSLMGNVMSMPDTFCRRSAHMLCDRATKDPCCNSCARLPSYSVRPPPMAINPSPSSGMAGSLLRVTGCKSRIGEESRISCDKITVRKARSEGIVRRKKR